MNKETERKELEGIYCEKIVLSNYLERGRDVHSKLIPNATLEGSEVFICPRCSNESNVPEHGRKTQCDKCRLGLLVYGNALYIWET